MKHSIEICIIFWHVVIYYNNCIYIITTYHNIIIIYYIYYNIIILISFSQLRLFYVSLTLHVFFSQISSNIEYIIERQKDRQLTTSTVNHDVQNIGWQTTTSARVTYGQDNTISRTFVCIHGRIGNFSGGRAK